MISKWGWRYFEANKIDRNDLKIRKTQKGTGTKKAEKLKKIPALFSTQRPPDDWPNALDHLAIGLEKQVKVCYLVRGCPI